MRLLFTELHLPLLQLVGLRPSWSRRWGGLDLDADPDAADGTRTHRYSRRIKTS